MGSGSKLHWSLLHKEQSPIYQKLQAQQKFNLSAQQSYDGQAPTLFVGRYGYPNIRVGLMSTPEYNLHDAVPAWVKGKYSIEKIINLRTQLVNSTFSASAKHPEGGYVGMSQEVAMAVKPTDIEVDLQKKPQFRLTTEQSMAPFGPSVDARHISLTSNPHIPTKVDKVVSDTDAKAVDGMHELYKKNLDEYYLSKLLSAGTLGVNRKLVPTRWSITAVDDSLGKRLLTDIRSFDTAGFQAFFGSHLGNYFLVLFFDDMFAYELFEMHQTGSRYTTDYEDFSGRKGYAEHTAGGYYAARLPILEYLHKHKQQAGVLVLRLITNEYYAPLGVWVVREAVRNALQQRPIEFGAKDLLVAYAKKLFSKRFGYDVSEQLKASKFLARSQTRLFEY